MATAPGPRPAAAVTVPNGRGSRELVLQESANEFVFAVVGHVGSGTSLIAQQVHDLISQVFAQGDPPQVKILKARDVIEAWANKRGRAVPPRRREPLLEDAISLQDLGDEMRAEPTRDGQQDHAAIARGLALQIRSQRAQWQGEAAEQLAKVIPNGTRRAYILDSIRHPAEVHLLRHVYGPAFVLIGVVCEEKKRTARLSTKYSNAGNRAAQAFMERDANARPKHGQHVGAAFHLADFFVDNTVDRTKDGHANRDWNVPDQLHRLIRILMQKEVIRPTIEETAMYQAYGAQIRSACLSRQVGAVLIDSQGNVVGTGTNEAPMAGGGVYGEARPDGTSVEDARCAMFADTNHRYCRNQTRQEEIILEVVQSVSAVANLDTQRQAAVTDALHSTALVRLLEFSRAIHAEMDAVLSAARKGIPIGGTRLFVTTFPCHYCARHIVSAGIDEVQYIEPYPKSQALDLHDDAIAVEHSSAWRPASRGGAKVLFRPFSGVAPRLYRRAFTKDRDLKDARGRISISEPQWGSPWHLSRVGYPELEERLAGEVQP